MRPSILFVLLALLATALWACPTTEPEDDDDDTADDDAADDDTGDDDTGDDDTADDDTGDDDVSGTDYTVTSSSGSFTSISSTGTTLSGPQDTVTLPFDVLFYGTTYSAGADLDVNELGIVGFSTMFAIVPGDAAHYHSAGVTPCIAAHHHSTVEVVMYSEVQGSAPNRTLVIEWKGTYMLKFGKVEVQLRFDEGSDDFEIVYGDMEADAFAPTSWTQLSAQTGTTAHETYIANQTAVSPGTLDNTVWTYDWN